MMKRQRGWGAPDFTGIVAALLAVGVFFGFLLFVVLPYLWQAIKPMLRLWLG